MRNLIAALFAFLFLGSIALVYAQDAATKKSPALPDKEQALSGKYDQLEAILLRMAEMNATTNPRRATLLKKVIAESKDRLIPLRFEEIVAILQKSRFTQAIDAQTGLEKDLGELLKLLESENREKLRVAEKEKIKEVLKEIEELILQQRSLKGRTTEAENLKPVAQDQEKIGDKTRTLSQRMGDIQEIGPPSQEKTEQKDSEPQDGEKDQNKDSQSKPNPQGDEKDKSKDSQSKPNPQDGENQDGSESPEDDDPQAEKEPQEKSSPTQQAMREAQKRMKRAQEQLEKAEKKGAVEDQEEAIAELQKARAELERLLRQLREEELMQSLQYLDARLRKMLQLEKAIRAQTERLEKQLSETTDSETNAERQVQILASRLSVDQSKVIEEADAALVLLREDGTAQAMNESLEQTRFDMLEVEQRLARADVSATTQTVEDSIIEAIQEMIDAVTQAKKDSQERDKKQQNSQGQASEDEQNLINQLSELRMIRTMQRRVNERTARYEQLLGEGKSDLAVLEKGVDELARQQLRIRQILRDLSLGRNR